MRIGVSKLRSLTDWLVAAQSIATLLAAFVQIGVKQWMFANVKDICSPNQADFLTCPHNEVFFTASAIWYVVQGMVLVHDR